MFRALPLLMSALALAPACAETPCALRTVRELLDTTYSRPADGVRFDIAGTVLYPPRPLTPGGFMTIADGTGAIGLYDVTPRPGASVSAGDRIRVTGHTETDNRNLVYPSCRAFSVLGRDTPPPPKAATAGQLLDGTLDFQSVSFTGTVRDIFIDEIDPRTLFFVLSDGSRTVYAALPRSPSGPSANRARYEGAVVTVQGVCTHSSHGYRRHLGRYILVCDEDFITVVRPPTSPFDVPALEDLPQTMQPIELNGIGRRRTSGRVIAVWQGRNVLVRRKDGSTLGARTADGAAPRYGDRIEIVGFPETDLYQINLARATWREAAPPDRRLDPARDVRAGSLLLHESGTPRFNYAYHGRAIRLNGIIRILPQDGSRRMVIDDDGHSVPVDLNACEAAARGLSIGCEVEISGICVMETDSWRPNSDFPHVCGIVLVPRAAADLVVLRRPPWWTPRRLAVVIAALLAVLSGILAWNAALRRLAARKGHELFKAQVAKVSSELRIYERTRLAVELHDSISQNLTGVSMQIDSAGRFLDSNGRKARLHLGIASRTLDSCREELRNCIWDLRSRALEERVMGDAIRMALLRHIGEARLDVRFNVSRTKFSDKTAHDILCIIRELAVNAVRHGHAKEIHVAGAIDNGMLRISVADDGCGFDVASRPGIAEGHFGIQGIMERIKAFRGTLKISSAPGHGTRAVVEMALPKQENA
ncbi:MAG: sensor histidine kinase [Verrucomicrobiota bacterium]|nr:sensor histidine kinase [Verrucomicrobiota bacterium]